jgi:hypothetical protein
MAVTEMIDRLDTALLRWREQLPILPSTLVMILTLCGANLLRAMLPHMYLCRSPVSCWQWLCSGKLHWVHAFAHAQQCSGRVLRVEGGLLDTACIQISHLVLSYLNTQEGGRVEP